MKLLPADLVRVGELVTWWHVPAGQYGFGYPVDARIEAIGPKRITITVLRRGQQVRRHVYRDNLRLHPSHEGAHSG